MKVISDDFETINKASIVEFLTQIRNSYNLAKNINIILDGSGYHRSNEVKNFCKENNITVHFLPPYSPNLNPIERLWKVMNERTRNNQFFASAKEFKEKIRYFFSHIIPEISDELRDRITDNFRVVSSVSSR